jgi:hypothetical protein
MVRQGSTVLQLDEPVIDGITHQLDGGAEFELAEDIGAMGFDRFAA